MPDVNALAESHGDLLQQPLLASFATRRPDGSLQVNPVWFDWDGSCIRLSLTTTRQKLRNLKGDPAVTLCIVDPELPFRYVELRGVVSALEDDPDRAFVRYLAGRYLGANDVPQIAPNEQRVILSMTPSGGSARP